MHDEVNAHKVNLLGLDANLERSTSLQAAGQCAGGLK